LGLFIIWIEVTQFCNIIFLKKN